uniref:Dual specificity phosphatase catalytic domain n=1 Tax=viral metagenome TaxID=1070528 RepID=A0A6C0D5T3_9ZZZZ
MIAKENVNLILPGLYLGNARSSLDDEFLKKNNIRAVFNCTKDLPFHYSIKNKYRIPVDDNLKEEEIRNLELWSFESIYKLTREHKQGNVLVHCYAGMQRSAAVVAMYLIATYNMKHEQAISYIKHKRSIAFWPYTNFLKAIKGFERTYINEIVPKLIDEL